MKKNEDGMALKHILRDDEAARIREEAKEFLQKKGTLNRTKSYDPPEGWQPLVFDGQEDK